MSVPTEAARRRTFAIISHPDAGKTTLTERLLQLTGTIASAGRVKARPGRRATTSDWMALEQQRGISVTSTVLRFAHGGVQFNLLDTPGHHDFSEDTYRVLSAADGAIMLLDAARGVEEQTWKLFAVARRRQLPVITFVNKIDRPGLPPLALLDDVERTTGLRATPASWPVGPVGDLAGLVDRVGRRFIPASRHGASGLVHTGKPQRLTGPYPSPIDDAQAREELELLDAIGADLDRQSFLERQATPVFFGCAVTGYGVASLLDAVVDLIPSPQSRRDAAGDKRPLDGPFSAFVFKVQANLDPRHRDRIAFLRVCSGRFEPGTRVTNARTGRTLALNHAHEFFARERETLDVAYPGDIIGVSGAGDLRVSDTVYAGDAVTYPSLPTFVPELFSLARNIDTTRYKQFRRGLALLDEEGVVQLLHQPGRGPQSPVLAGAGVLQFEVATHRLEHEFGARVTLEPLPYRVARATGSNAEPALRTARGAALLTRTDGACFAVFESDYHLRQFTDRHPDIELGTVVA